MAPCDGRGLAGLGQPLMGEGRDRGQQPVARLALAVQVHLGEAKVDQLDEGIEDVDERPVLLAGDLEQVRGRARRLEDRHATEHEAVAVTRERMGRLDRRAEVAMAIPGAGPP